MRSRPVSASPSLLASIGPFSDWADPALKRSVLIQDRLDRSGSICRLGGQQLTRLCRLRNQRRVVDGQIEGLLELNDVVDLGTHRDIGNAFEDELDHDR